MIYRALEQEEEENRAGEAFAQREGRAQARRTAQRMQDTQIESCMTVFSIRNAV